MQMQTISKKSTFLNLGIGFLGGLLSILLTKNFTEGYIQVSVYPIVLIVSILTVPIIEDRASQLTQLVITGFVTFMTAAMIHYVYLIIAESNGISVLGHLWRLLIISLIGLGASVATSLSVKKIRR